MADGGNEGPKTKHEIETSPREVALQSARIEERATHEQYRKIFINRQIQIAKEKEAKNRRNEGILSFQQEPLQPPPPNPELDKKLDELRMQGLERRPVVTDDQVILEELMNSVNVDPLIYQAAKQRWLYNMQTSQQAEKQALENARAESVKRLDTAVQTLQREDQVRRASRQPKQLYRQIIDTPTDTYDEGVKSAAVRALANAAVGDKDTLKYLKFIIGSENYSERVKSAALEAFAKLQVDSELQSIKNANPTLSEEYLLEKIINASKQKNSDLAPEQVRTELRWRQAEVNLLQMQGNTHLPYERILEILRNPNQNQPNEDFKEVERLKSALGTEGKPLTSNELATIIESRRQQVEDRLDLILNELRTDRQERSTQYPKARVLPPSEIAGMLEQYRNYRGNSEKNIPPGPDGAIIFLTDIVNTLQGDRRLQESLIEVSELQNVVDALGEADAANADENTKRAIAEVQETIAQQTEFKRLQETYLHKRVAVPRTSREGLEDGWIVYDVLPDGNLFVKTIDGKLNKIVHHTAVQLITS